MCRWEENIKANVKDIDFKAVNWNNLTHRQKRDLVNTAMKLYVLLTEGNLFIC
jgi:hypothetical protein